MQFENHKIKKRTWRTVNKSFIADLSHLTTSRAANEPSCSRAAQSSARLWLVQARFAKQTNELKPLDARPTSIYPYVMYISPRFIIYLSFTAKVNR